MTDTTAIAAIQGHFHAVILGRAAELIREHRVALPQVEEAHAGEANAVWFPVPGMHGGFKYWFEARPTGPVLISESWSRVVGGSGQRHEITADGAVLVDEGFV